MYYNMSSFSLYLFVVVVVVWYSIVVVHVAFFGCTQSKRHTRVGCYVFVIAPDSTYTRLAYAQFLLKRISTLLLLNILTERNFHNSLLVLHSTMVCYLFFIPSHSFSLYMNMCVCVCAHSMPKHCFSLPSESISIIHIFLFDIKNRNAEA